MSLGSENRLSVADIAAVTDRNNGNCGNGWGGGFVEMLIAMIMLFLFPMFFGGFGGGMWGGMGGWGNGGMMAAANGALTRADLYSEFNFNGLENAVRGVTQGLYDGFYAMQNSINGLGMNVMQGFSQAELSRANQQAALMQQLNNLGYQQKDCCCETQRSIDGVKFTIAQEDCNTRNLMQTNTQDIIDSQNSGFPAILDKMCQQELAVKDDRIARAGCPDPGSPAGSFSGQSERRHRRDDLRQRGHYPAPHRREVPHPGLCGPAPHARELPHQQLRAVQRLGE